MVHEGTEPKSAVQSPAGGNASKSQPLTPNRAPSASYLAGTMKPTQGWDKLRKSGGSPGSRCNRLEEAASGHTSKSTSKVLEAFSGGCQKQLYSCRNVFPFIR